MIISTELFASYHTSLRQATDKTLGYKSIIEGIKHHNKEKIYA